METMADNLITHEPFALSSFMTETIFVIGRDPDHSVPAKDSGAGTSLPSLGGNARRFVFMVNEPSYPYMAPAELEALKKMLAASGMSIDDVAVVNTAGIDLTAEKLHQAFQPVCLVLLGASPRQAGLPEMEVNQSAIWEGIQVLYTYSFSDMMENTGKKKLFWERFKALKK
jgi:hypothetical protein